METAFVEIMNAVINDSGSDTRPESTKRPTNSSMASKSKLPIENIRISENLFLPVLD